MLISSRRYGGQAGIPPDVQTPLNGSIFLLKNQLEDANHALAAQRSDQVNSERRLKKLEATLADAQATSKRFQDEKDQADRDMRERETLLLTRERELEDLQERLEDSERQRSNLSRELEELLSHTDDAGKGRIELEQANFQLDNQLKELKQQFEELEDDQAQLAMEKQRADVSYLFSTSTSFWPGIFSVTVNARDLTSGYTQEDACYQLSLPITTKAMTKS